MVPQLLQNVQDMRRRHKLYQENHVHLESGIYCKWEKLSQGKDSERCILGRFAITMTIYKSNDATQLYKKEAGIELVNRRERSIP